jgi:hypothetical protein
MVQRAHRQGRLSDVPIPPGKLPAVPIRLNLLRKEIGSAAAGTGAQSPYRSGASDRTQFATFTLNKPLLFAVPIVIGVLLLAVWSGLFSGGQPDPSDPLTHVPEPGRSVILAMKKSKSVTSQEGGFTVSIPAGWEYTVKDGMIQAVSPGGEFALDVVRYAGLDKEAARRVVGQDGAAVTEADPIVENGISVRTFAAKAGTVSRIGVLLQRDRANDAPLLALLEGDSDHMDTLPMDTLSSLLVRGISISATAPTRPVAKATPAPPTTPAVVAASTPAIGETVDPSATMMLADSGIKVVVPDGWTGTEDAVNGVLAMESPDGLDIRIAATERPITHDDIFRALREEGWLEVTTVDTAHGRIGHFRLGDEHIGVAVIDRNNLPTGVIYAHRRGAFTAEQLAFLRSLIRQVAAHP